MINSYIIPLGLSILLSVTPNLDSQVNTQTTASSFKLHNLTLQADSLIDNTQGNLGANPFGSPFAPLIMEARSIDPNHPETLYLEGLFSESMNKPDFAEGAFLQAIYLAPAFERAYIKLIALYLQQNQLTKAQQMIRPLIDIAGPSLDTQFLMATILYRKGKLQEALTIFENLEEVDASEITPHYVALQAQYKPMMAECQKRLNQ